MSERKDSTIDMTEDTEDAFSLVGLEKRKTEREKEEEEVLKSFEKAVEL